MSEHTKGPWVAKGREVFEASGYGMSVAMVSVVTGARAKNGFVESYRISYDEARANARLVAAAPDLLAALTYAVDNPDFDSAQFDTLARTALRLAKHGIAPAQAEQS